MSTVFRHGDLRLYLLALLAESPRHGYDVIVELENRFHGTYSPSAGTIYPRLAKLEAEGLVTHAEVEGRKVYSVTPAGHEELAANAGKLADVEQAVQATARQAADQVRRQVGASARELREELRASARDARREQRATGREKQPVADFERELNAVARDLSRLARRTEPAALSAASERLRAAAAELRALLEEK